MKQVRRLPGNDTCADCSGKGIEFILSLLCTLKSNIFTLQEKSQKTFCKIFKTKRRDLKLFEEFLFECPPPPPPISIQRLKSFTEKYYSEAFS